MLRKLLLPFLLSVFFVPSCEADEIFRAVDRLGRVTYSSKPLSGATTAILPDIHREDYDKRLKNIRENLPLGCDSRGGIDCLLGSDKDGSVICADGFRDGAPFFIDHCSLARLAKDHFSLSNNAGEEMMAPKRSDILPNVSKISLSLRNQSGVTAKQVQASFRFQRKDAPIQLDGPAEIEPYGAAEYSLSFDPLALSYRQYTSWILKVTCENCANYIDVLP